MRAPTADTAKHTAWMLETADARAPPRGRGVRPNATACTETLTGETRHEPTKRGKVRSPSAEHGAAEAQNGFGFIQRANGSKEVFVHLGGGMCRNEPLNEGSESGL